MKKMVKAIRRLQWRIRYTLIGQEKLPSLSIRTWWDWSATDYDEFGEMSTPHESVMEEIYAMAASQ